MTACEDVGKEVSKMMGEYGGRIWFMCCPRLLATDRI